MNALHHLHLAGFVHCDVKPANVVVMKDAVTGQTRAALIDFGSTRLAQRGAGKDNSIMCTYAFCAPEALQHDRGPTPACDAYSLGALIYFYLFKKYMIETNADITRERAAKRVRRLHEDLADGDATFPDPNGAPKRIVDIMQALLRPDPLQRMTIVDLFAELVVASSSSCSAASSSSSSSSSSCVLTTCVSPVTYDVPCVPETHKLCAVTLIDRLYGICCTESTRFASSFALSVDISLRHAVHSPTPPWRRTRIAYIGT